MTRLTVGWRSVSSSRAWLLVLSVALAQACAGSATQTSDVRQDAEVAVAVPPVPSLRITVPADGAEVEGVVTVMADVSDGHAVRAVTLYVDNQLTDTDDAPPYELTWDATRVDYGTRHTLRAIALPSSEFGEMAPLAEDGITVVVVSDWPPLRFEEPLDGAMVSGDLPVRVRADESLGEVTVSASAIGLRPVSGRGPLFAFSWSSCDAEDGELRLDAAAEDPSGKLWRARVDVVVNNLDTPPVLRGSPAPGAARLEWDACGFIWGFTVYWSTTPGVVRSSYSYKTGGGRGSVHTGREPGRTYYYRVAARDGDRVGALSNEIAVTAAPRVGEGLCNPSGWCWEGPGVQAHRLRTVWAMHAAEIRVGGDSGTVLRGDGATWHTQVTGFERYSQGGDIHALWGTAADDVWAVGPLAGPLHWDGVTWHAWRDVAQDLTEIWGVDAGDIWAVGGFGSVVHWDGADWTTHREGVCDYDLNGVWASGPDDAWAVGSDYFGSDGALLHWDGSVWTHESSGPGDRLLAVWGSGPSDVWAAGRLGRVLHWDGVLWEPVGVGLAEDITAVHGTGPDDAWAVGVAGLVLHWDGAAWRRVDAGTDRTLWDVWAVGPDDVWLVGERGAVLHWDGAEWHDTASRTTVGLADIAGGEGVLPLAVGAVGVVVQRNDEGWQPVHGYGARAEDTLAVTDLRAVGGSGIDDVWAVGDAGAVAHWDGAGWRVVETGSRKNLKAVWVGAPDRVWATGAGGVALHWDGARWDHYVTGALGSLQAVWGTADNDVWAAGDDGALYHWDGFRWRARAVSDGPIAALWGSGPDDVWAVGRFGPILHYDGDAWAVVHGTGVPLRGVSGSGSNDVWVLGSDDVRRWDGARWTTVPLPTSYGGTALWVGAPDDVWVVAADGSYRWNGTTWQRREHPPGRMIRAVWGVGDQMWACGERGILARWAASEWELARGFDTAADLAGVWIGGPDDIWAVGELGTAVHWDGAAWTPADTGATAQLHGVGGSASDDVWAVGDAGVIVHWDGARWSLAHAEEEFVLFGVWAATPEAAWAVGAYIEPPFDDVHELVLRWDGELWRRVETPSASVLRSVWGTDASNVWAVGGDGGGLWGGGDVLHWDGVEWRRVPKAFPVLWDVHGDRHGNVWAVGENGAVEYWDGERWDYHATGTDEPLYAVWTDGTNTWAVGYGGTILRHRFDW
jgi:hypothetical protein